MGWCACVCVCVAAAAVNFSVRPFVLEIRFDVEIVFIKYQFVRVEED